MNKTTRRSVLLYALIGLFFVGLVFFAVTFVTQAENWVFQPTNAHIYNEGKLSAGGSIFDREGEILAQTSEGRRVYHTDELVRKAMLHTVGDTGAYIRGSIQYSFQDELLGYNLVDGVYSLKERGRGNDITTTVSASISKAALNALNGRKGAVCVYNYKTGEVLCMVSSPTFDPENKPDVDADPETYDGVYLNRCISGLYPPGSTFKLVTAAAAIDNLPDIDSQTFQCSGEVEVSGGKVVCSGVHGQQTFKQALTNSCNVAFTEIAIQLGEDKLREQAEKMGFNQAITMDGVQLYESTVNIENLTDCDLGWAAIGQHQDLVTPMHMAMISGAIANHGVAIKPYFIGEVTSFANLITRTGRTEEWGDMLSTGTADTLRDMMQANVTNNYGEGNFPGLTIGAKTGTAEVGDGKKPHSWMTGFVLNEECPVAFSVVVENAGFGMQAAGPVANAVLQETKSVLSGEE